MRHKTIFSVLLLLLLPFLFLARSTDAAILYFTPSSGNIAIGDFFTANVYVDTKNTPINNAEAIIDFPSNLLSVVSVSRTGSIFNLWVEEPSFSNTAGVVIFNGGLPTPGFNGSAGKIASIVFRAKKVGNASLIFSSAAVRANDGLGTDIFDGQGGAKFTLQEAAVPKVIEPTIGLPPKPFIKHYVQDKEGNTIFSHDSEKPKEYLNSSYNKLEWFLPTDVSGVSILLNDKPSSNPGSKSDGLFDNKVYENLKDGIYYLHIRFISNPGAGPILHYKFGIDATPPKLFQIILPDGEITANPTPRIKFETSDALSGIARYDIKIDDGNWFNAAELKVASYILPKLSPGEHQIFVRAYDKADNYVEESAKVIISAIAAPEITNYPANIISPGEKLVIEGTAAPKATVEIHMNKKGQAPVVFSAQADENGDFEAIYENVISSGAYEVWAKQILQSGSESLPSVSVYIGVNSWFWRAWQWVKNVGGIVIVILIILASMATAGYYFWHQFRIWRIKLKKEVREAEMAASKGFKKLRKEIKSAKSPRKILKDLSEIEKSVEKEIKDIEKK